MRSFEPFKKQCFFGNRGALDIKLLSRTLYRVREVSEKKTVLGTGLISRSFDNPEKSIVRIIIFEHIGSNTHHDIVIW